MKKIKVTIWNEHIEASAVASLAKAYPKDIQDLVASIISESATVYPKGIHGAIADLLKDNKDASVKVSLISDAEQGLSESVLNNTDVLIW